MSTLIGCVCLEEFSAIIMKAKATTIIYKNFKKNTLLVNECKVNFVWKQQNFKRKDTNVCQLFAICTVFEA